MKLQRKLILLFYIFVSFCFIEMVLTGRILLQVKDVGDILSLLEYDSLFIVRVFKLVFDYRYDYIKLIGHLIQLIPIGTGLFLILSATTILPRIKQRYKMYILLLPTLFIMITLAVVFSLQSVNVNAILSTVKLLGFITFISASVGLISTIVVFFCFMGHLIDVQETKDYTSTKETAYDRKL